MILVDAEGLTMHRPDRPLFSDVALTVAVGDRVGVVGINGTGKSTLLRVLAGRQEPESGVVRVGQGVRIVMMDQDDPLPSGSVLDLVTRGAPDEPWRAEEALTRLGMGEHFDRRTDALSGGEAKRVALASALVRPSDLLVLDEPTNHLDLAGIAWLEDHLAAPNRGLIVVSHDRHLLDQVTTRIVELDRGQSHVHHGGYASYLEAVVEREAAAASSEQVRRNLAKSELAWLRRGAKARTRKPKARIDAARALLADRPQGPARPADLHLEFPAPRLGDVVIELTDVAVDDPSGRPVLSGVDLIIDRDERVGILGPNGSGKTSLLDVIAGLRPPTSGSRTVGSTVSLGYYRQLAADLDPSARVRDVVAGPHREADWTDARLLEAFWFDPDAQWAPVATLSGGERRRLQLLNVLAARPNVLLLDEPSNDLDLETLRALEDFLDDWSGPVIVASHDRTFLERVVRDALVLDRSGSARRHPGGFAAWESEQLWARPARRPAKGDTRERTPVRTVGTLSRLIRGAERDLERLHTRQGVLADELASADDHRALARIGDELATIDAEIETAEQTWMELAQEQEARQTESGSPR